MATIPELLAQAAAAWHGGQFGAAEHAYQQLLQLDPGHAEALARLGLLALNNGRPALAEEYLRRAAAAQPADAGHRNNLGVALDSQGRFAEAEAAYREATRLRPDYADAHHNRGNALRRLGRFAEAEAAYRDAVRLQPDSPEAHNSLGTVLACQGRHAEAAACYQQALRIHPDHAGAHNNLGLAFMKLGRAEEAAASYQQALRIQPDYAGAHNNLGLALKDQGRLDEAVGCFRRAGQLLPALAVAHSNLVYTLHFCPEVTVQTLADEHRRWNQQHAEPLARFHHPHANDRSPERRLRVGYLSPDFRWHPVGRFLLPLLAAHDHDRYEIVCYDTLNAPDAITDRCRAHADVWRPAVGLSDEQLAAAVRRDGIDILVDLTMHMANNRLLVFARKPAPVQVTYLAYCGTTGLRAMDYRLTDPYLDPPGRDEPYYSERSVRLPETYWCYQPLVPTPPVSPLPAGRAGAVTFGCLNNFCKVTDPTLAAWARLLRALPAARLLLHAHPGGHRERVREALARQGVAPDRLTFVGKVPAPEYFQLHERLDVALDPFPYGGGTTTCDALWMGVPVVSLAGATAVGRGGLSILTNVGLADLVAHDVEQYVGCAVALAEDLPRLRELRAGLRGRMQASPLMDAPRFARNVEAAYRHMWQRWCAR
jgi:predicted O-linked N-acetylglucosamine transferase (SPINDLY family)